MILTYDEYIKIFADTKLSVEQYNILYTAVYINFKPYIVYSDTEILNMSSTLGEIKGVLAIQINHSEINGLANDGITSQSTAGVSVSVNNKNEQGSFNWHPMSLAYLKNSPLGIKRV